MFNEWEEPIFCTLCHADTTNTPCQADTTNTCNIQDEQKPKGSLL